MVDSEIELRSPESTAVPPQPLENRRTPGMVVQFVPDLKHPAVRLEDTVAEMQPASCKPCPGEVVSAQRDRHTH